MDDLMAWRADHAKLPRPRPLYQGPAPYTLPWSSSDHIDEGAVVGVDQLTTGNTSMV